MVHKADGAETEAGTGAGAKEVGATEGAWAEAAKVVASAVEAMAVEVTVQVGATAVVELAVEVRETVVEAVAGSELEAMGESKDTDSPN